MSRSVILNMSKQSINLSINQTNAQEIFIRFINQSINRSTAWFIVYLFKQAINQSRNQSINERQKRREIMSAPVCICWTFHSSQPRSVNSETPNQGVSRRAAKPWLAFGNAQRKISAVSDPPSASCGYPGKPYTIPGQNAPAYEHLLQKKQQ